MNEQQALEYAKQTMHCKTCRYFNSTIQCIILCRLASKIDLDETTIDSLFESKDHLGCNYWQPK